MTLKVQQMTASYGASQILFGIDLEVDNAETVCVLGRNGVGKTTTLKTIMGMLKPRTGSILFNDNNIGGLPPYKISQAGIAYIPQGRQIFPNLTTKENLRIGARKSRDSAVQWTYKKIYELFPVLKNRESLKGSNLSGGEQQMLTIARGLMQNPKLILMDEITEGLAPIIVNELVQIIEELKKSGVSILLAEQNIKFAMAVSSRCYILEKGQVVFSGNVNELPESTLVKYMGTQ
jgi:branched-chain amino acid transport system ATP-binding protein